MVGTDRSMACRGCLSQRVELILDGGSQPICNRFSSTLAPGSSSGSDCYSLKVGVCAQCALVQVLTPPPYHELTPVIGPMIYNEPETHLDEVASDIESLCDAGNFASIWGVSYKDASLIERLKKRGFKSGTVLDMQSDLHVSAQNAGMEQIQNQFTKDILDQSRVKRSHPLIFIGRHILEHSFNIPQFLSVLRDLIGDAGTAVLEVPDNTKVLLASDYSFLWEEHLVYFTPQTLRVTLERYGFEVQSLRNYEYPYENSLVAIIKAGTPGINPDSAELEEQLALAQSFGHSFIQTSERIKESVAALASAQGKLVMVGAGHLSAMFINLFRIAEYFSVVLDDNPLKKGHYMPGSGIEIKGTEYLSSGKIGCALLSLNPESEAKFIANQVEFNRGGGKFFSIFRLSERSLCPVP